MTVQAERQKTQVHNEVQTQAEYSFVVVMGEDNIKARYICSEYIYYKLSTFQRIEIK